MQITLPSFFVVGAPKSGTGFIHTALSSDPRIVLPKVKESHYFSFPEVKDTYYQVYMCGDFEEYKSLFKTTKETLIAGEICPNYLFYPNAPLRIKKFDNNAKIIIILRHPVERALSHYLMDVTASYTSKPLLNLIESKNSNRQHFEQYVEYSRYYDQINRYQNTFDQKNLLILDFDSLKQDPKGFLKEIYSFLRLSPPEKLLIKKIGGHHRDRFGFYRLKRKLPIIKIFMDLTPKIIKNLIRKILFDTNVKKEANEKEKLKLYDLLEEDMKNVATKILWTKKWQKNQNI